MRLLVWNCNNGISNRSQIDYFKSFRPDIAILPELKEHNIPLLEPDSFVWRTNNFSNSKPKGLGVLAFNGYMLEELRGDPEMEIYLPIKVSKDVFTFSLLAFWNFYSVPKQGRFKGVKGKNGLEFSAIKFYQELLSGRAIFAGDLNFGPTFFQDEFLEVTKTLESFGQRSLYHHYYNLTPAESRDPTFRSSRKRLHHLDHVFGSVEFVDSLTDFRIEDFANVVLSDHAPLVVDFSFRLV